ncbi:hypothetical protein CL629_03325 [bacterium]|nr:hypothetical protein [bacterium]
MLVTMLFISGLILVGTTVSGLLVSHQIRQAADTQASTQALFAADAGTEDAFYCYRHRFHSGSENDLNDVKGSGGVTGGCRDDDRSFQEFNGREGTLYTTTLRFKLEDEADLDSAPIGFTVTSEGQVGRTRRVLQTFFDIKS